MQQSIALKMTVITFLVEEAIEGGYHARAIGESLFTEGDTLDELKKNIRDAVQCHFDSDHLPKIIGLHLVRKEIINV